MDHHRCGGIGQATVAGGEVPHTAQQGARCAAHQHQGLREEEEDGGVEERGWDIHLVSNLGDIYL